MSDLGDTTGTATVSMTVSLATYDRLSVLLRGASADHVLARLLNRDPHDHDHLCPTCARRAHHLEVVPDPDQEVLFDERAG